MAGRGAAQARIEVSALPAAMADALDRFERHLRLEQRAGDWWVCFADGRPFHPWRSGEFVHPCADDLYRGRLSLDPAEPDLFELVWEVTGPAKRQRLVSRLRRQPLAASTTMPAAYISLRISRSSGSTR